MSGGRNAFNDVVEVIETYFDGLHQADSAILATIFHEEARYVNATPGDYMNYDMPTYFDIVDRRTSPTDRGEERDGRTLSISFGEDRMAFVVAHLTMLERDYLDYLTLIPVDGKWKIIAKVFSYTERNEVS